MPWWWQPGRTSVPTRPDQSLVGAWMPTSGHVDGAKRNAYRLVPGAGQAASARAEVQGAPFNDRELTDGWAHAQVAYHPNGLLVEGNTAGENYSLAANSESYRAITSMVGSHTGGPVGSIVRTAAEPRAELVEQRDARLSAHPEVLVRDAAISMGGATRMSIIALGLYGAYSAFF